MKLYTYFRSGTSFRVRIALNLKGIVYDPQFVSLPRGEHRAADYTAVNPQALVPLLVMDDGMRLAQSLAIIEYLDEVYPRPPLLPRDAKERARVRSISLLFACEIHPLNNLRVLQHLKRELGQSEDQLNAWYRHWIAEGLAKVEGELGKPGTGRFCHGDTPSMADCCLVPQIFAAKRYQCDLAPYPTVMRVFDECMKMDAFDLAQPSKQPDAE